MQQCRFSYLSNDAEDLREQNKELIDELMTQNLETLTRQNRTESELLKRELQQTIEGRVKLEVRHKPPN